jgi:hypothetical protein
LADVDKPQLKLVGPKPDAAATAKSAKAKTARTGDNPVEDALDDDDSANLTDSDPARRETLNILSDLIDYSKSPRTVGR